MGSYSFRSAINGFNREDVVHYLEYINTKNANQIAQLEREIARLQGMESQRNQVTALEQENAQLRRELEALRQEAGELRARNAEAVRCGNEELEAYRRAERTERQAQLRAEQICQKATGIVADTGARLDTAMEQVGQLADAATQKLMQLHRAVEDSKTVLQGASTALRAVFPEVDE